MIVKVDVREKELLLQINKLIENIPIFKKIVLESEVLPIGDIIITDETLNDKLIIERKSVADLLASIKDGRYEEQSFRLNGSQYHNHNIIYLIEGDLNKVNHFKTDFSSEKLTLYSAMFSLNYYKGFSIFRSFSLTETATIICNMAYKLDKDTRQPFYQNKFNKKLVTNNELQIDQHIDEHIDQHIDQDIEQHIDQHIDEQTEKDYVNVIKKVKKENITPDNISEIMLCQIPGISSVTALSIMKKFQTIPNLIKELEINEECLKDICSVNSKGQTRKINKTSIANITKFLLKK